jgi:hypothetical protein
MRKKTFRAGVFPIAQLNKVCILAASIVMAEISADTEKVATQIVDIAFKIHSELEPVYWRAFMKNAFVMNLINGEYLIRDNHVSRSSMMES